MDQQQFVGLLQSLMQPDTDRVKAATATLNKDYYKSPEALTTLLQILVSHEDQALRQLAAVEARKLVGKHWASLPDQQKPEIRNQLLQSTMNQEVTLVRHSSARVVAAIAKNDLEDGQWADLPQTLHQAAGSDVARHREVAVFMIYTLIETMGDLFSENFAELFNLLGKTINDPASLEVRVNTMMALSRVAMLLDPEEDEHSLELFNSILPSMVKVLEDSIASGDEDKSMQAFEVFQTLLGCESALLNKHFEDLVNFMNNIASKPEIDDDARSQALAFLMQCVRYRKLKVQAKKLGEKLTISALHIVTELGDLSSEDEEVTPARSALGLLDILSQSLPPNQVIVPLLHAMGSYVNSENPDYRRAGILALGMCVEGAPDFIATQLGEILPLALRLLEDPEVKVRAAALNGVARLADDLAEEMAKEHGRLIPALVKNLDMAVEASQGPQAERALEILRGSCNAIDSLIEGLDEEDAAKYVGELVPRFNNLFNSNDFKTKIASVGAVGSVAAASGGAFLPFFQATMQALGPFVQLKESQDDLDLRGVVCDSMGKIAGAVGPAPFRDYVQDLMRASEEALNLDHPRLRETSYILWSTMAKVYEEDFESFLPGVVEGLLKCLSQDETDLEVALGEEAKDLIGQEVTVAGKKIKVADATDDDDDDGIIDLDDEDDDDDWDDLNAVTAVAMEKEIAVEVIGDVISSTRHRYVPYLAKTIDTVLKMVHHAYEGVRKSAIGTLWRSYATLWGMAEGEGMAKWKPGLPLQIQPSDDLAKLAQEAMNATLEILEDEMDRGTVTDICRDLGATLKLTGPAILVNQNGTVIPQLTNHLIAILTKRHPCQQDLGDELDEALDESSEYDWLVIEVALDCVTCLSAALGESFAELWKIFEKPIMKYASGQESVERSNSVGSMADCIGNMGAAVTPFTTTLMKLLVHRLSDEDPETRSNAAYAVGMLCEKSNDVQEILKNFPTIFTKLEPMLHEQQQARMLDNAAGCISRMIMRHPEHVPLQQVLPRLVELLPLREDFDENQPVYTMLMKLYGVQEPQIQQLMQQLTPQLMQVFEKVLGPPEDQLEDETKQHLISLVQRLRG
ncbi:HEAT domain-containing protein [Lasiodiplodia theobromae]|uniref:Importin subunit beta-4 n=1 Tax=Lasiodiplodia theobromae TaxID=45133 RepID=A0A5N5D4R7_9PEZI|nr:Importin beta-4 subunit protein [Lasiodiplodia theobromae]KAB2572334.1 Importin subunit beta-4 [Lasiodiplodia theobromae]KAF4541882.1 Importin beta-4 subunit protein [Lasiodiplodia theobromae]KAF9632844.1 HEAT domain-containing protein [Lasiodiplodia theobromae]